MDGWALPLRLAVLFSTQFSTIFEMGAHRFRRGLSMPWLQVEAPLAS